MVRKVIGVDVGGTKILAGVVVPDGTIVSHREHRTPLDSEQSLLDGLYPADQLTSWKEQGQSLGYRVGITPAADWQFFVAGD